MQTYIFGKKTFLKIIILQKKKQKFFHAYFFS